MDASSKGIFRHQSFKEKFSPLGCVTCKTGFSTGIQTDLTVTSCFQMRHGVMTEYIHPKCIQDRRRCRLVDVEDARRNRRLWIRIMWRHRFLAAAFPTYNSRPHINVAAFLRISREAVDLFLPQIEDVVSKSDQLRIVGLKR